MSRYFEDGTVRDLEDSVDRVLESGGTTSLGQGTAAVTHTWTATAASTQSPADIANLSLWYDPSDAATRTMSGSNLASMTSVGSAWGPTLASVGTGPTLGSTNGLATVEMLQASNHRLTGTLGATLTPASWTFFQVYRLDDTITYTRGFSLQSAAAADWDNLASVGFTGKESGNAPGVARNSGSVRPAATYTTTWRVFVATCDAGAVTSYVDGVQVATGNVGASAIAATRVGYGCQGSGSATGDSWNGGLAETGFYTRALTSPERTQLNDLLTTKWLTAAATPNTGSAGVTYTEAVTAAVGKKLTKATVTVAWAETVVARGPTTVTGLWKGATGIGDVAADLALIDASWWYNWWNYSPGSAPVATPGVEYVPMIWGDWPLWGDPAPGIAIGPADTLLGYNEPDYSAQANMTVARALELWPEVEATGARLGSPAPSDSLGSGAWLADFMNGDGAGYVPRVDFICLHWYSESVGRLGTLADYLDTMHALYGKPIWLTEVGSLYGGNAANATLITQVMDILAARPWVERVAWFTLRDAGSGFSGVGLVSPTGTLTGSGTVYATYDDIIIQPTTGTAAVAYTETVTAAGVKPAVAMKQGTAAVAYTEAVTAAVGKRTPKAATTTTHTWVLSALNKPTGLWKGAGEYTWEPPLADADLKLLDCSWYYNWGNYGEVQTPYGIAPIDGIEYVPMMPGDWVARGFPGPAGSIGTATTLLGFNEPDIAAQSNMTVARALTLWPQLEATGARLGSPAPAATGLAWLADFMDGDGVGYVPRVDFICLHWYTDYSGGQTLADFLDGVHAAYPTKPIWLTEVGNLSGTFADNAAMMPSVIATLAARPWVERVAWYTTRDGGGYPQAYLVNSNGTLTASGTVYATYDDVIERPGLGTAAVTYTEAVTAAVGKRTPKATSAVAYTETVTAAGVKPVVAMKQGTAAVAYTETVTASGRKLQTSTVTTTYTETVAASGRKLQQSTVTTTYTETVAAAGRKLQTSTAATTYTETTTATGRRTPTATTAVAHTWTLAAQGVKPIIGVKQGTAAVAYTTTTTATGRKLQTSTVTVTWRATPTAAVGTKTAQGTGVATYHWVTFAVGQGEAVVGFGYWNRIQVLEMAWGDTPVVDYYLEPA
jgi:hypothetical protein